MAPERRGRLNMIKNILDHFYFVYFSLNRNYHRQMTSPRNSQQKKNLTKSELDVRADHRVKSKEIEKRDKY